MKEALQAVKALCSIEEHSNEAHIADFLGFARRHNSTLLTVVVQPQNR